MMGKKGLDVIKNVMLGGVLGRERNPSSFWQQRMPSNCFLEDSLPDVSSAALRVKHAGKVRSPRPGDEQRLLQPGAASSYAGRYYVNEVYVK